MAQDPKPTQAPLLCATGCGFYGNPRTNGMCSVCYRDSLQKHNSGGRVSEPDLSVEPFTAGLDKSKPKKNRCFTCRRKVGLTGFGCRCGNLFCGVHRYSDLHSCTFDYKADAAQKIRKENPVIVGERIKKI